MKKIISFALLLLGIVMSCSGQINRKKSSEKIKTKNNTYKKSLLIILKTK